MTRNELIELNKARREAADLFDSAGGSWYDAFWKLFDPEKMSFEDQEYEKKLRNRKYSEKRYRLLCYEIYWFENHANIHVFNKDGFNFDRMEFSRYSHKTPLCWNSSDPNMKYCIWFETKAKMPVPSEIHLQYNPELWSVEEWMKLGKVYNRYYY
jgi:hypothetical protein